MNIKTKHGVCFFLKIELFSYYHSVKVKKYNGEEQKTTFDANSKVKLISLSSEVVEIRLNGVIFM